MAKYKTKKYEGMSFSQVAKAIEKRYPNKDNNPQEMRGFQMEIENLMKKQEVARLKELAIEKLDQYKKPTNVSKYADGGPLDPTKLINPLGSYQDNRFIPLPTVPTNMTPAVPDSPLYPNPFQSNPLTPSYTPPTPNVADGLTDGIYAPERLPELPIKPIVSGQVGTNTAPQVTDDRSGIQDKGTGNMYAPLAIGKGIEFAGKLAMLAGGYDKVTPQYNPNEARIESLMANRSVDTAALENQALSQQNVALQNLSDVRSPNVKRALISNVIQSTLKNLQGTKLQENQINNQLRGEYANTLNNLGQQRVAATNYSNELNNQSKGVWQQGMLNALGDIQQIGQKLTDYKSGMAQQEMVMSLLSTKDFKAGSAANIQSKLRNGQMPELGDFIELYSKNGLSQDEARTDYTNLMAKIYGK